jgi:hypothetical protein
LENSNLLDTLEEFLSPMLGWDLNYIRSLFQTTAD